jgi:hypothetical protein
VTATRAPHWPPCARTAVTANVGQAKANKSRRRVGAMVGGGGAQYHYYKSWGSLVQGYQYHSWPAESAFFSQLHRDKHITLCTPKVRPPACVMLHLAQLQSRPNRPAR